MADLSGVVVAGGTAQALAAFNPRRKGLVVQVPDTEETVWLRFGATAAAVSPSMSVAPGETLVLGEEFKSLIVRPISIFGATTDKKFTAYESLG